jgi:hypothetical protein
MKTGNLSWAAAMERRDFAAIADWFIYFFSLVGGIGLILVGFSAAVSLSIADGLRIFVLSLLFSAASAIGGWLLGLLFGIPRSLARLNVPATAATGSGATNPTAPSEVAGTSAARTSRVNTNLEDISDWLTKTIVGVGLTQLFSAPHYLWHVAGQLNTHGFGWSEHGQLLALSLFFYFAPGGFWLGYVGTRTILTQLFETVDRVGEETINAASNPNDLLLKNAGVGIAGSLDPRVASADQELLGKTLQQLTTAREMAAWGAAQARAGNLAAAQTAIGDALRTEPNNPDVKELAAIIFSAAGQHNEASRLLQDQPLTDIAVFNALYQKPPEGFTQAMALGERLLTRPDQARNDNLLVWLACAYGQQYAYEKGQQAPPERLEQIKGNARRAVEAALAANPQARDWLRSLAYPAPQAEDDDLKALADDGGLTDLLGAR